MICKKKQKKLKYKSDFLLSKILLDGVLYYSVDGFNFSHSRTQRFNLNTLYFSDINKFNSIIIVEIENKTDTLTLKGANIAKISMKVNDLFEILILIDEI